jgi:hypothetical protein
MIRALAAMMGAAALASAAWLVTAGASVASASTRLRSGTLHAQLVSHVASGTSGANSVTSGLALKGSGVMAGLVAALAVFALAFLVVTFIRRRVSTA